MLFNHSKAHCIINITVTMNVIFSCLSLAKNTMLQTELVSSGDTGLQSFQAVETGISLAIKESNVIRHVDIVVLCGLSCQSQDSCFVFSWNQEKEDCILFEREPYGRHFSVSNSVGITYYMKQPVSYKSLDIFSVF